MENHDKKNFLWLSSRTPIKLQEFSTFADCARFWARSTQSYQKVNTIFYLKPMTKNRLVYKSARDTCTFTAMRGHVASKKSDEIAFPWRQALFWNLNDGSTLDPNDLRQHEIGVDQLYAKLIFLENIDLLIKH